MKKLILSLITLAALSASAQPYTSQDFLNVQAVIVTNTIAVTNLTLNDQGTNIAGTAFTNNSGSLAIVTGANGLYDDNLLKDVHLWADRQGRWWPGVTNATWDGLAFNMEAPMHVSVNLIGQSGANAAVTFTFAPVWDDEVGTFVGSHDSADRWEFSFTATTTTELSRATNVPVWRWPGAKGLRCLRIVNADTDATSHVVVRKLKLNGYMP